MVVTIIIVVLFVYCLFDFFRNIIMIIITRKKIEMLTEQFEDCLDAEDAKIALSEYFSSVIDLEKIPPKENSNEL